MSDEIIRIASRGSPLALAQANLARDALAQAHGWERTALDQICPIRSFQTTGDRVQERPLAELGGKGLFAKEIEDALLQDEADIAIHSMKDLPAVQPPGLALVSVLEREDPHDVFLGHRVQKFSELSSRARVGTSSVRRTAQALRARPDLKIVPLRGNVQTRLDKLSAGEADGIFLARAGLARLDLLPTNCEKLSYENWLPALCQGAIGLEIRSDDEKARRLVTNIDHTGSHLAVSVERGFLAALDGSCRTPISGLALIQNGALNFRGEVLSLDGQSSWGASRELALHDTVGEDTFRRAHALGAGAAKDIRAAAGVNLPKY
jgi:hydroxymethylbilane synthase